MLTSIIFLFIKHPFDVGDRVVISKETYTVKEIRLLSTVFLDSSSALIQAPNNQLNSLVSLAFLHGFLVNIPELMLVLYLVHSKHPAKSSGKLLHLKLPRRG